MLEPIACVCVLMITTHTFLLIETVRKMRLHVQCMCLTILVEKANGYVYQTNHRVRLVLAYMKMKSAFGMVEHLGAFVSL